MNNNIEASARMNRPGGEQPAVTERVSGPVCPIDATHRVAAVPALYAAGRGQIGITLRHGPSGVQGWSSGQAHVETALSAALAPPAPLPSWQRPAAAVVGAVGLGFA